MLCLVNWFFFHLQNALFSCISRNESKYLVNGYTSCAKSKMQFLECDLAFIDMAWSWLWEVAITEPIRSSEGVYKAEFWEDLCSVQNTHKSQQSPVNGYINTADTSARCEGNGTPIE